MRLQYRRSTRKRSHPSVTEIDVTNVDAYNKEYVPVVRPVIAKSGGKLVAVSQDPASIEGAPQKSRVAINVFESLEGPRSGAREPITKRRERSVTSTQSSAPTSSKVLRNSLSMDFNRY